MDYGNTETVPLEDLRALDDEFKDLTPCVLECFLDGVQGKVVMRIDIGQLG